MSDDLLEKIYSKVEKISEDVGELKINSALHEETLKTHMKRSDTLESMYNDMKKNDIEPIKADINKFKGTLIFLTYISTAIGLIAGLLKFLHKI